MKDNSVKSNTIEWLRFFCCAAVVLLHAFGGPLEGYEQVSYHYGVYDTIRILFSQGLCRVAVPTFFLFSGYLFFVRLEEWDTEIWIGKLKKRAKTLLIPYLLWSIIAALYRLIIRYLKYMLKGGDTPLDVIAWFYDIGGLKAIFWDAGNGWPINVPLWFMRDLMVFILLAPLVYCYVKKTGVIGIILLYLSSILWKGVPGLSTSGLFFFSFGALLSVRGIDFALFFKKYWIVTACIAFPLVVIMVLTWGNHQECWGYIHRVFTLFGSSALIGCVAFLFQNNKIRVHPLLSKSTFLIYAAHGPIVLPIMQSILGKVLPGNQLGLIVRYFTAPLLTIVILVFCYYYLSKWMPKTLSVLTGGRVE